MRSEKTFFVRDVLFSSGELTKEAVIVSNGVEYYESAPLGETLGLKETQLKDINNLKEIKSLNKKYKTFDFDQNSFDSFLTRETGSQLSTSFSMACLRFLSEQNGFSNKETYKYISKTYNKHISCPKIICNLLNGSAHAYNKLAFCEFMIIPKAESPSESIKIASEVYCDLKSIIKKKLGEEHLMIGREGGFSPFISSVKEAISFLGEAINKRHPNECSIAIDVAANNFCNTSEGNFIYKVDEKEYDTDELVQYYLSLLEQYPLIEYLEDPFHENDINGWKSLFGKIGKKILLVADDLTVTKINNLKTYSGCFNGCILKINQAGSFTELLGAYNFCVENSIMTIISQRSGETDSNLISHIAVGLGSDYFKSGAPARERIVKYNELMRIADK